MDCISLMKLDAGIFGENTLMIFNFSNTQFFFLISDRHYTETIPRVSLFIFTKYKSKIYVHTLL
jgi:hypothetical protein